MFDTKTEHKHQNQKNYSENASDHNKLGLDSTLYLAYRDIGNLLKRHFYHKITNNNIRFLDFGCGVGLSTEIVLNQLKQNTQYIIEAIGVDISDKNLEISRNKIPNAKFQLISENDKLNDIGLFDLIICNFVLVEMTSNSMLGILKKLKTKLSENGILIVTNPTAKAYRQENQWYTFNNKFSENIPSQKIEMKKKMKYQEDQPIKVQVFASGDREKSFTFFDYFHSGSGYREAYNLAGLKLLETHKPIGVKEEDGIDWKSELMKAPYKIHVLGN